MIFKHFFSSLVLIIGLSLFSANVVLAQSESGYDSGSQTFEFYLNFSNGILKPAIKPNDFLPYSFIAKEYVDQPGLYYGKVFSMQNQELAEFFFDLIDGDNNVLAPHFPEAKTVLFYKSRTDKEPMLSISVSKTAICNQDQVCQMDAGETETNCRSDCGLPDPINGNVNNAPSNEPDNKNSQSSNQPIAKTVAERYYDILIVGFVILGLATVVVFVIMFIRRNRN